MMNDLIKIETRLSNEYIAGIAVLKVNRLFKVNCIYHQDLVGNGYNATFYINELKNFTVNYYRDAITDIINKTDADFQIL